MVKANSRGRKRPDFLDLMDDDFCDTVGGAAGEGFEGKVVFLFHSGSFG